MQYTYAIRVRLRNRFTRHVFTAVRAQLLLLVPFRDARRGGGGRVGQHRAAAELRLGADLVGGRRRSHVNRTGLKPAFRIINTNLKVPV